jgi:2-oxoglutarate dehydrogenase E2 component (dihydrolipoamide succinyltransferase)
MTEIRVPRLNSNDVRYILVEWLAETGAAVREGDPVAVVETSKAAEEIAAPRDGRLHQVVPAGREYPVGELIGHVTADYEEAPIPPAAPPEGSVDTAAGAGAAAGVVITAPAREAAVRLGVDPNSLVELGKKVVRREDVERLATSGIVLDRQQLAVAATVARSHATIPAGFSVVRVVADEAIAAGRAATRRLRTLVGLPEIFLTAVAGLATSFPHVFATPVDGRSLRPAADLNIAVTIDVGRGLYTPVVRNADRLSLGEIAAVLGRHRHTAMRGRFRADELTGASILLSLSGEDGVVFTQPMVHPGQIAALSLGSVQRELAPAPGTGEPQARRVLHLGMSYDHRYLNGGDAVRFLLAVKAAVERPAAQPPSAQKSSAGDAVR